MRRVDLVTGNFIVENRVGSGDPVVDKSLVSLMFQGRTVLDDVLVESDDWDAGWVLSTFIRSFIMQDVRRWVRPIVIMVSHEGWR